jgi:hypothetical protein
MEKLKVFLSWSGPRSKAVAEALWTWLPGVLQSVDPFLSAENIDKGAKWGQAISGELAQTNFAIICLTPANLAAPWLLFEAGALSKLAESRVWTYLIGLEPSDVKDPLSEFQHTSANKTDTRRLLGSINQKLTAPLSDASLTKAFDMWWPELEEKLHALPEDPPPNSAPANSMEKVPEMVAEILDRVREQNKVASADVAPPHFKGWRTTQAERIGREIEILHAELNGLEMDLTDTKKITDILMDARVQLRGGRHGVAMGLCENARWMLDQGRSLPREPFDSAPIDPPRT